MDWNDDGKKDLLTGERWGGIYSFINQGTDQNPSFDVASPYTGIELLVGGSPYNPSKNNSMLYVSDWNNDGKKDLIVGFESGDVYFLQNAGTNQSPVFDSASPVMDGGSPLSARVYKAEPAVADWDGDGKKDLLIGAENGQIYFFRNQNTDSAPLFNGFELIQAGGQLLDVGWHSRISITDWNNDKALDLIVGDENGYVHLFLAETPASPPAAANEIWMQSPDSLIEH